VNEGNGRHKDCNPMSENLQSFFDDMICDRALNPDAISKDDDRLNASVVLKY
jgi:hypothetical protein